VSDPAAPGFIAAVAGEVAGMIRPNKDRLVTQKRAAMLSLERSSLRNRLGLPAQTQIAAGGVLLIIFGLTSSMVGLNPTLPALAAAAFVFLVLWSGNHSWIVHAMLVALFMTTTPEIPRGIRVFGVFIYFYEFLIFGALIYAVWLVRENRTLITPMAKSVALRVAFLFSLVIAFGITLGIVRGYPFWDIQYDAKSILEMMVVVFIATVIVMIDDWQRYIKTITAILFFSATLMVYASATGFVLWGRVEAAELYAAGGRAIAGGSNATRYLTQTTPLALAVLIGSVVLLLLGTTRAMRVMPMLIPSLVISVLSFSRNTLLALAGAFVFALLISLSSGHFSRLLLRLAMVTIISAITILGIQAVGNAAGAGDWINTQSTGYMNRVLAGFDQSNERADTSARYREEEDKYIMSTGAEHPILGGGFGTHYKPPSGKRDTFFAFEGTLYSHNAYNWLYVKVGIVGLVTFITLIATCIVPAFFRRLEDGLLATSAATLGGLSCAIFVTPMPIEQPGSAVLGIIMGLCIGANASRTQQSAEREHPLKPSTKRGARAPA
jgi:O-Antigen ligase